MKTIRHELNKLEDKKNYKQILKNVIDECETRLQQIDNKKFTKKLKEHVQKNHEKLIELLKIDVDTDIHVDNYTHNHIDIGECGEIIHEFTIGPLSFFHENCYIRHTSCTKLIVNDVIIYDHGWDKFKINDISIVIDKLCIDNVIDIDIDKKLAGELIDKFIEDIDTNLDNLIKYDGR